MLAWCIVQGLIVVLELHFVADLAARFGRIHSAAWRHPVAIRVVDVTVASETSGTVITVMIAAAMATSMTATTAVVTAMGSVTSVTTTVNSSMTAAAVWSVATSAVRIAVIATTRLIDTTTTSATAWATVMTAIVVLWIGSAYMNAHALNRNPTVFNNSSHSDQIGPLKSLPLII